MTPRQEPDLDPVPTGRRLAVGAGCVAIAALLYLLPNRLVGTAVVLPLTALDRAIPFVPASVWAYALVYPLLLWSFFGTRDWCRLRRLLMALMACQLFAAAVFVAWPVAFPRGLYPIPADTGPIHRAAAEFWRRIDAPVNCLPSLHAANAVLCLAVFDRAPLLRWRPLAVALATLTVASTLSFKQHYVIDLIAGAVMALVAWWALLRRVREAP